MAVSISSAGITTFGAGVFLGGAVISIFTKFAILICSTVLFSMFYALLYFSALCHVIGPENSQGDISCIFTPCRKCCKKDKKEE
jgi:multidrug efflux pump subunit AcrB